MIEVANQETDLFDKGFLDSEWSRGQRFDGALRKMDVHLDFLDLAAFAVRCIFFLRKAATSAPSLNGPK